MSDANLRRVSPLGSIRGDLDSVPSTAPNRAVTLRELPFGTHHVLRFDPSSVRVAEGLLLPTTMNTAVTGPFGLLAWVGPDEWWLWSGARSDGEPVLAGAVMTDVSHGHTAIEVRGEGAAALLARGTPLDLHPTSFPSGSATRTHIDKTGVLLIHGEAPLAFYLVVRRSFANYLWAWLHAAAERLD